MERNENVKFSHIIPSELERDILSEENLFCTEYFTLTIRSNDCFENKIRLSANKKSSIFALHCSLVENRIESK